MEYQLSFLFASILLEEGMRSLNKKQLIWKRLFKFNMLQQLHKRAVETLDFLRNSQDFPRNLSQFLAVSRFLGIKNNWEFDSILLPSGLNLAWHFWLSTRFFLLSEDEISWEHFGVYSRTFLQNWNWNCTRNMLKCSKTDSFLGNKKLSLNQNVWRDHASMQKNILLHFWVIFLY